MANTVFLKVNNNRINRKDKTMLKLLWKYVISFFTADRIGVLIRSLFTQIGKQLAQQILDPSNQQKAYEFVKAVA